MKMNDKVIVAFLVSMGLFSAGQATQYVNGLSMKDKKVIFSVVKLSDKRILLCESTTSRPGLDLNVDNG